MRRIPRSRVVGSVLGAVAVASGGCSEVAGDACEDLDPRVRLRHLDGPARRELAASAETETETGWT